MKKLNFRRILPWALLAGVFFACCAFMAGFVGNWLDSDMSGELILAKMLSREGGILSPNWNYSTELRVLNTNLIFAPLFAVFDDWRLVRVAGSIILYLILLGSMGYFCRQAKLGKYFPLIGTLTLLPLSMDYFYILHVGVFYIPHVAISFAAFGLCLQGARKKRPILPGAALLMLSVAAGMGGLRQLLVLYVPLALAAFGCMLLQGSDFSRRLTVLSLIGLAGAAAGHLLDRIVLSRMYTYYDYGELAFTQLSFEGLWAGLTSFLTLLGYREGGIFSPALLHNATCALLAAMTLAGAVATLRSSGRSDEDVALVLFLGCGIAVFSLLYAATDTPFVPRYNVPILVFVFPVLILGMKNMAPGRIRQGACGILILCLLLCGARGFYIYAKADRTDRIEKAAGYLTENGYTEGYAAFWNANVLTELTDGGIEVWSLTNSNNTDISGIDQVYPWLQAKAHQDQQPAGRFFLLLSEKELESETLGRMLDAQDIVYRQDGYVIFAYDSQDAFARRPIDAEFAVEQALMPGERHAAPGATLYPGRYRVRILGGNLDQAKLCCDAAAEVLQAEDSLAFTLAVDSTQAACFAIENPSAEMIWLGGIEIDSIS